MRAAAAALPEPCSATTSTGTSFCDSSRITASTVRMPALTLSSQTRAPPFCGIPAGARIWVLSRSILLLFTSLISQPKTWGEKSCDKGSYSLEHTRCQSGQWWMRLSGPIYAYVSMICDYNPASPPDLYVTTLRTNGKFIAHTGGNILGHYFPPILGIKS